MQHFLQYNCRCQESKQTRYYNVRLISDENQRCSETKSSSKKKETENIRTERKHKQEEDVRFSEKERNRVVASCLSGGGQRLRVKARNWKFL